MRFAPGGPRLRIRELTGYDEQSVRDWSTATAIGLLDRVVEDPTGASWRSASLTPADRDRLLAGVYRVTFGSRVSTTSRCGQCGSLFDLSFSLNDLLDAVDRTPLPENVETLEGGVYLSDGVTFRLPTGEDEIAVAGLPAGEGEQALVARCIAGAPGIEAYAAVEQIIEEMAPMLDLDIDTACPECGAKQKVRFDVQYYLLQSLEQERKQIAREIHRLASAYQWSLAEILSLRRSERRAFVELIESESAARRRLS